MKVGSIVECVNNSELVTLPKPKLKVPYTVKALTPGRIVNKDGTLSNKNSMGVKLEEIETGTRSYAIEIFRELLPPMEIQSALDECETVLIKL